MCFHWQWVISCSNQQSRFIKHKTGKEMSHAPTYVVLAGHCCQTHCSQSFRTIQYVTSEQIQPQNGGKNALDQTPSLPCTSLLYPPPHRSSCLREFKFLSTLPHSYSEQPQDRHSAVLCIRVVKPRALLFRKFSVSNQAIKWKHILPLRFKFFPFCVPLIFQGSEQATGGFTE